MSHNREKRKANGQRIKGYLTGYCTILSSYSQKQAQAMSSFQNVIYVFEVECWKVKAGNTVRQRHRHSWNVSQTTKKSQKRDKIMTERREEKEEDKT